VLGQDIEATDAVYATKLLADQAIALSGDAGGSRFLGVEREGPASAASALSRLGVAVVTLGSGTAGLVRVTASEGSLHGPFTEPPSVFCPERLHEWANAYP
jgi:hypothetical protein